MVSHSFIFLYTDPIPVLDEEFDKVEATPTPIEQTSIEPALLCDDLAWDDQLDNGEEMSV